jgi:hypothetical protein
MVLVALALAPLAARAQGVTCPEDFEADGPDASVFLACQLDVLPNPEFDPYLLDTPGYRSCAGVPLRVTIDSRGGVSEAESLDSASPQCGGLARRWQFSPGRRGDEPVGVIMLTQLRYEKPEPKDLLWDPTVLLRGGDGALFELVVAWQPSEHENFRPLSIASIDSAFAGVLSEMIRIGRQDDTDHYCVDLSVGSGRLARVFALMGEQDLPIHPRSSCPSIRTDDKGDVSYDTDRPYLHVGVRGTPRRAAFDAVVVDVWFSQGLSGAGFWCRTSRDVPQWAIRCVSLWAAAR